MAKIIEHSPGDISTLWRYIPVGVARLCCNCDVIHAEKHCPRCESKHFVNLGKVLWQAGHLRETA